MVTIFILNIDGEVADLKGKIATIIQISQIWFFDN